MHRACTVPLNGEAVTSVPIGDDASQRKATSLSKSEINNELRKGIDRFILRESPKVNTCDIDDQFAVQ